MKKQLTKKNLGKKRESFWKRNYSEIWGYIQESKPHIWAAFGIFVLFFLLGLFLPAPAAIEGFIKEVLKQLLEQLQGITGIKLILLIFKNNALVGFFGIFLGIILGIYPLLMTLVNGYVLGYVCNLVVSAEGIGELWRIFPHGVFELPAAILSFGIGIKLGMFLLSQNANLGEELKRRLKISLKIFLLVILPLLIIAAIIEGILITFIGS